jgi:hypothetical protein
MYSYTCIENVTQGILKSEIDNVYFLIAKMKCTDLMKRLCGKDNVIVCSLDTITSIASSDRH